jgi:hypothetical protein
MQSDAGIAQPKETQYIFFNFSFSSWRHVPIRALALSTADTINFSNLLLTDSTLRRVINSTAEIGGQREYFFIYKLVKTEPIPRIRDPLKKPIFAQLVN